MFGHLGPVTDNAVQLTDPEGHVQMVPRETIKQIRLALQPSAPAGK